MNRSGGNVATADYVFCDSDVLIDIAKGGGKICDAFLAFVGSRAQLVEDVLHEAAGWAASNEPWANHLEEMLTRWPTTAHVLTDLDRDNVAAAMFLEVEQVSADAKITDKGETATVIYLARWAPEQAPDVTVLAITDVQGTRLASANGIACCAIGPLLKAMQDADLLTESEVAHVLKVKARGGPRR